MSSAQTNSEAGWGVYAQGKAEAWSNGVPVLDLDGDWSKGYKARGGTQRAYAFARTEVGALIPAGWSGVASSRRIGALTRMDASATLSGGAAQVVYHYQSRIDPAQAGSYNADSSVLFWQGRGLSVHAPTIRHGAFSLDVNWDHLNLSRMRSLQSQGTASYGGQDAYGYQMRVRDDSWKTTEPFMRPPERQGVGDALSVAWRWQDDASESAGAMPSWVSLKMDDVWSSLYWRGINGDDAVLDSQVSSKTPEGYIEYQAAIQGQYTRRNLRERIPRSTQVQLGWQRPEGTWGLRVQTRSGLWQRWLSWEGAGLARWQVGVEPTHKALLLGVAWRGLGACVMADRLDTAAHVQGGQLSWVQGF